MLASWSPLFRTGFNFARRWRGNFWTENNGGFEECDEGVCPLWNVNRRFSWPLSTGGRKDHESIRETPLVRWPKPKANRGEEGGGWRFNCALRLWNEVIKQVEEAQRRDSEDNGHELALSLSWQTSAIIVQLSPPPSHVSIAVQPEKGPPFCRMRLLNPKRRRYAGWRRRGCKPKTWYYAEALQFQETAFWAQRWYIMVYGLYGLLAFFSLKSTFRKIWHLTK